MNQSDKTEFENVIAERLITQVETGVPRVLQNENDEELANTQSDRGGEEESFEEAITANSRAASTHDVAVASAVSPAKFAKVEKSLASLGFFTPSSRRVKDHKIKRIGFTREVDGKRVEVNAEIIPSAIFGLPVTADQDKYLALQQIITDTLQSEGRVTNPIRFKSADLIRLLNKSTRTGKNYKEISEWLDVMTSTTIFSNGVVYKAGQKSYVKDRFRVFDRAVSVGKEMEDGAVADANYVWLSSWQLENINHKFLLPIDLDTYRQLKNHIAKALVPLLQIWLFATHKAGSFEKRYDELCEILTLQVQKHPSLIVRQFRPSLDELTALGYLGKWRVEKTSDRKAYKIIFFHGPKFHRDRRKRVEQKTQASQLIAESSPVEPVLPEPGRFETKGDGKPPALDVSATPQQKPFDGSLPVGGGEAEAKLIDELSARGVMPSTAMKLLRALPQDRLTNVGDYIDYWDSIKKTRGVGEGLLYTLIQEGSPLPTNFETRTMRENRQKAEDYQRRVGQAKDALIEQYKEYRTRVLDEFIDSQKEDFERRVAERKEQLGEEGTFWEKTSEELTDAIARNHVRSETAKDLHLLSFEEFRDRELPRITAAFRLEPSDLGSDSISSQPVS